MRIVPIEVHLFGEPSDFAVIYAASKKNSFTLFQISFHAFAILRLSL